MAFQPIGSICDFVALSPKEGKTASRRGAEGAEVEMGICDAINGQAVTRLCIRKGNLSILCALCASARKNVIEKVVEAA